MKGGIQQLMKQANQLQNRMKKLQEELAQRIYEATSGGGAVKVVVKGENTVNSLEISEEVIKDGDKELLQDMIVAALNEALKKAKEESQKEMEKLTGGMQIPGLM